MFRSLFGSCRFFVDFFIVSFFRRCCQLFMGNNMHALHNFHTRKCVRWWGFMCLRVDILLPQHVGDIATWNNRIQLTFAYLIWQFCRFFFFLDKREIMFNVSKVVYLQWNFHSFVLNSSGWHAQGQRHRASYSSRAVWKIHQ